MEVAVVVVKMGSVHAVEKPKQAQPVRTKSEAWFLKMAGVGTLEAARLSSWSWWFGSKGGGVMVLTELVGVTFLCVGEGKCTAGFCSSSSARAMCRRRGFEVTVIVFRGIGVVTQTSVWPITVVIVEPTKELQKLRTMS